MKPALSRGTVDRAALRRKDDAWVSAAWCDPSSVALVVDDGRTLVHRAETGPRLALVTPAEAGPGERFLLGVDPERAYWAVAGPLPDVPGARPAGLREVGALLDDRDAGLYVHAVALANWHATHPLCPRCGDPTRVVHGGAARHCDRDGSDHFPRTDPAVIVLVHDGGDRCVLGRQRTWPPRRFSILAGFVEPGESAEQALVREVAEEVGLRVTDLTYVASQPWPFPSSLMLGYTARAADPAGTADLVTDPDELAEARWFTRAEVAAAADGGSAGLLLPPPVSIAWRIITDWVGAAAGTPGVPHRNGGAMSQSENQSTGGPIGGRDDPGNEPAPGGAVVGGPGIGADPAGGIGDPGGEGDLAPERDTDDPRPAAGATDDD